MRTHHIIDQRLSVTRPFSAFPRQELEAITTCSEPLCVEAGTRLTRQGQFGDQLLIVISGAGVATLHESSCASVGPGDTIGDMAVLGGTPNTTSITATDRMEVLAVSIPEFKRLVLESPTLIRTIAQSLASRLFEAEHALQERALQDCAVQDRALLDRALLDRTLRRPTDPESEPSPPTPKTRPRRAEPRRKNETTPALATAPAQT